MLLLANKPSRQLSAEAGQLQVAIEVGLELAMVPALITFALGVSWLNITHHFWSWWPNFVIFLLILALLVRFLHFEAYRSASSLAQTLALLVSCMKPDIVRALGLHTEIAQANEPPKLITLELAKVIELPLSTISKCWP